MKRTILTLAIALLACSGLGAQTGSAALDSAFVAGRIFHTMPGCVTILQSPAVRSAIESQTLHNSGKMFYGFRIRLYYGNSRTARGESASCENRFRTLFPEIPCERTYTNPNFKVTAGNFRTRTEAEKALRVIKGVFSGATIVKERFRYPSLDGLTPVLPDSLDLYNPQF